MEKKINLKYSDDILKDLYLASFYDEKKPLFGPLRGNIYLDKPWTKQFLKKIPNKDFNIYAPLFKNYDTSCADVLDEEVLYFNGEQKFTNRDLIEMSKNMAAGIQSITNTPKIAVFVNNTIEEPTILLAASLCGGMVYFVDITKSPEDMRKSVDEFEPNMILMDEKMTPLLPFLNQKQVPVIVANTTKDYNTKNMFSFREIIEIGKEKELKPTENFDPMAPFLIITSSGTTGRPKPIVHSNYSINQAALKVLYTDYPLNRDNVMMKIIPAHIGLGIITTLYTSLISGTKLAFIEGNGPEESVRKSIDFVKNYNSFRERNNLSTDSKLLMFAAPMFYRFLGSELSNVEDLSYMGCMLAAGSKMGKEELDSLNELYSQKGCKVPICVGYGSNENAGAVTLNNNSYNSNGSGGFPIIGTDVLVVDDNNNPILNKKGRILVRSGSQFLYYLNMEEDTNKARINIFNTNWVEMNDIGYINEFGFLFITGRTSRVIIKHDCKISIDAVEEKMRHHPAINECAIVALENDSDDISYAFITAEENYDYSKLMSEIENTPQWLSPLEKPNYVIVLDKMLYMNNGKIDYVKLKELAKEDYNNTCNSTKKLIKNPK